MITLHWGPALTADDDHADLVVDLEHLGRPGGGVYAEVTKGIHFADKAFTWRWAIESNHDWPKGYTVASGYANTQQEARTAVMTWLREEMGTTEESTGLQAAPQ